MLARVGPAFPCCLQRTKLTSFGCKCAGSPLVLGIGDGEYLLASDTSAIIQYTANVLYIEDGEIVQVTRRNFDIVPIHPTGAQEDGKQREIAMNQRIQHLETTLEQIEKGGYKHFMLKEIMEQVRCLRAVPALTVP